MLTLSSDGMRNTIVQSRNIPSRSHDQNEGMWSNQELNFMTSTTNHV